MSFQTGGLVCCNALWFKCLLNLSLHNNLQMCNRRLRAQCVATGHSWCIPWTCLYMRTILEFKTECSECCSMSWSMHPVNCCLYMTTPECGIFRPRAQCVNPLTVGGAFLFLQELLRQKALLTAQRLSLRLLVADFVVLIPARIVTKTTTDSLACFLG